MHQDKYSIGWNTFQTHLQETHVELYKEKHFADVTLVSDDMVQVMAHRTVLSSASSVFKQLLMMNESTTNQILFLKGIKHQELESLLQFIYLGEAKVYENRIEMFVSISKDLGIKELNMKTEDKFDEKNVNIDSISNEDMHVSTGFEESNTTSSLTQKDYPIIQSRASKQCAECNIVFSTSGNMKAHYKRTHGEEKFQCPECGKAFTQKMHLDRHVKSVHLGIRFPCTLCHKSFSQHDLLVRHNKQCH